MSWAPCPDHNEVLVAPNPPRASQATILSPLPCVVSASRAKHGCGEERGRAWKGSPGCSPKCVWAHLGSFNSGPAHQRPPASAEHSVPCCQESSPVGNHGMFLLMLIFEGVLIAVSQCASSKSDADHEVFQVFCNFPVLPLLLIFMQVTSCSGL